MPTKKDVIVVEKSLRQLEARGLVKRVDVVNGNWRWHVTGLPLEDGHLVTTFDDEAPDLIENFVETFDATVADPLEDLIQQMRLTTLPGHLHVGLLVPEYAIGVKLPLDKIERVVELGNIALSVEGAPDDPYDRLHDMIALAVETVGDDAQAKTGRMAAFGVILVQVLADHPDALAHLREASTAGRVPMLVIIEDWCGEACIEVGFGSALAMNEFEIAETGLAPDIHLH